MKKQFTLLFWLLATQLQLLSQSNFGDYTIPVSGSLYFEDFLGTNPAGWTLGTFENCRTYSIGNGYFEVQSVCNSNAGYNINNPNAIDQNRDFEIETNILFVAGEDNNGNGVWWGKDLNDWKGFAFLFTANGSFKVSRYNSVWSDLREWTISDLIRKNAYNKLTVRKISTMYYFFINEGLVFSCPFQPFYGQALNLHCNQNSTIRVDYLRVSYLERKQAVQADYMSPAISLYEPAVNEGGRIVTDQEQLVVRGIADDASGISDVSINGFGGSVDARGYFEQHVNLVMGDNTITIRARDTKYNTATKTFYVERRSASALMGFSNPGNEKRLALVIGNANYSGGQTLQNPANDASLMATTLQNLGFEVIKRINANKQGMETAIREFTKKLPNYTVCLFYYAGHGVQVDGMNYLIPTDATLQDKTDCKFEAISVNFVVEEFESFPNNVNIVILDACRNNPFRSWARGGERGFKAIAPTSGTIISFATSEGSLASDGDGIQGLFTEQLVKQMQVPQPIESVFKKTRVEVEKMSNGAQSPQEWSKLKGDFYFRR
ncbi:MAG: caspase family protein [Bacteroidales bacterium]|nr:caspase family protein [Bacteroidales bacterium]